VAESAHHPAKMLPAIAAHTIATFTRPGELVLDPMCGIGTTLVEAVRLGRRAVGVEYEPRWAEIARANLDLADPIERNKGQVITGDARHLDWLLPEELRGRAALILTSPPYGPAVHGRLASKTGEPIEKIHHRYGDELDRGNLANIGHHRLLAGFTRILSLATTYLRPGGYVAITVRPWREHAELIDLPAQIEACAQRAGLILIRRAVALLGRVTDEGDYVPRASFFQRNFVLQRRAAGVPLAAITHEDLLCFQRPPTPHGQRHGAPHGGGQ
jgi:tRNA G10  N-methylase Trm11